MGRPSSSELLNALSPTVSRELELLMSVHLFLLLFMINNFLLLFSAGSTDGLESWRETGEW